MTRRTKNLDHSGFVITGEGATVVAPQPAAKGRALAVVTLAVAVAVTALFIRPMAAGTHRTGVVRTQVAPTPAAPRVPTSLAAASRHKPASPRRPTRDAPRRRTFRRYPRPVAPPRRLVQPQPTDPAAHPTAPPPSGPGEFF